MPAHGSRPTTPTRVTPLASPRGLPFPPAKIGPLPPATCVLREDYFNIEAELLLGPQRVNGVRVVVPGAIVNRSFVRFPSRVGFAPSFARMTATQTQRRRRSTPGVGLFTTSASSCGWREALRNTRKVPLSDFPGPGEYLPKTTGLASKGVTIGTKIAGAQAFLGFGFKQTEEAALGDYHLAQPTSLDTSGVSGFPRAKRGILPVTEAQASHEVAGIQTVVHYTIRPLSRGTKPPPPRGAPPPPTGREDNDMDASSSPLATIRPPPRPSSQTTQKLPMDQGDGAAAAAALSATASRMVSGGLIHDNGTPHGLTTLIDRMIAEHQADYARSARELAKLGYSGTAGGGGAGGAGAGGTAGGPSEEGEADNGLTTTATGGMGYT